MTDDIKINQMNEAIALFMGGVKQIIPEGGLHGYKEGTVLWMYLFSGNADPVTYLDYHSEWSWLMQVVEKIEKDYCNIIEMIIYSSSCCINKWNPHTNKFDSFIYETGRKIDAVYKAVYQFIQWYNQQKEL